MYNIHDNVMKTFFNWSLFYSDFDSLLYKVKRENVPETLRENDAFRQHFDLSNYPSTLELYNRDQKKVTLNFKNNFARLQVEQFIVLELKISSISCEGRRKLDKKRCHTICAKTTQAEIV